MHIINILRDYMGLTQVELARCAGIGAADLNEIINKAPYGLITKYQKLASFLGVNVHCIVNNDIFSIPVSFFEKHPAKPYQEPRRSTQARIGHEAEDLVFRMEQDRLQEVSPVLSQLVLPYYKLRASSPGYDILSYQDSGEPIYIEVKNTDKEYSSDFRLTAREFNVAQKLTNQKKEYLIYFFSGPDLSAKNLSVIPFSDLIKEHRIKPYRYQCSRSQIRTEVSGIAYHRMKNHLSQIELASQLDIPPACLCKYELGENVCPVTVYKKLSDYFQVTIDELLALYPNPELG